MLDDLKMIHERDAQDALGIAEKQWQQLKYDFGITLSTDKEIQNVIIGGMGGSALAASIISSWPKLSVPLQVVRNYDLPDYAGENTLFIASSYSGNTEETLAALDQAIEKGCEIVIIASGGKLADIAKEKSYPFYNIPANFQPRMAVFYNFAALIQLFESVGLTKMGSKYELNDVADWLSDQAKSFLADVPTKDNYAKQIAQELTGKSVVIYSGPLLAPAGYKWKINFNENSKTVAWCNQLPEFNHNEFLGWTSHPVEKPYAVIDLRSKFENKRVQKRFEITERLLSGRRPSPLIVESQGDTVLKDILWYILLGDFVSLYLAFLNGLNPTPVELIEKLKDALKD
ncbi:bifunctional phosphoglucose/phosphomannose isomerase [Candidatus Saccharibacteria bacterium]|nr:bifunctional phosphoglucose/phosphomannose isomerase [Candidatus Saccharibacteria bacterium]